MPVNVNYLKKFKNLWSQQNPTWFVDEPGVDRHGSIRLEEGEVVPFRPALTPEVSWQSFPVVGECPNKRHLVGSQQVQSKLDGGVKPELTYSSKDQDWPRYGSGSSSNKWVPVLSCAKI